MAEILSHNIAGMGLTPTMRTTEAESSKLIRAAFDGGLRVFHAQTLGEAKRVRAALSDIDRGEYELVVTVRSSVDFTNFLAAFDTDHIDLVLIDLDNGYDEGDLEDMKKLGRIGDLGVQTRHLDYAALKARMARFSAVAMPLNCLACDEELTVASAITEAGLKLVALEPFAGGLWQSPDGALAFLRHIGALPMFGVQYMWQLEQILPIVKDPPAMDEEMWNRVHTERSKLAAQYCRGCEECMPCPAGIDIPTAARMDSFIKSMPIEPLVSAETERKMRLVRRCVGCGRCMEACRFHLPVRALMRYNAELYTDFLREHGGLE